MNAEHLAYLSIRTLVLALAQAAKADLDEELPAEAELIDLLGPTLSITPSTTELALRRVGKLIPALTKINAFNAAQVPVRPAVSAGGNTLASLSSAVNAHTALEQAVEDRASDVQTARHTLETETHAVEERSAATQPHTTTSKQMRQLHAVRVAAEP